MASPHNPSLSDSGSSSRSPNNHLDNIPFDEYPNLAYIRNYLHHWRNEENFPTFNEMIEPLNHPHQFPITREPPYHTTPILAARMIRQEQRINHMGQGLARIQGNMNRMVNRINYLHQKLIVSNTKMMEMAQRMERMEENMDRLQTVNDDLRRNTHYPLRRDHLP